eukprot:TRINITY_DN226_c0_g1_i7.p1 TRINITY_DN226_c0_g1~~TRINITY_DN226_c0_g1_i7.p1  ORF type:complete len:251 (+),score=80.33 TRINITY_DN226_c0_g1_i7:267-1019(+)
MSRKAQLPTKVEVSEDAAVDALAARLERVAIRYERPVIENDMESVSTPEDLSDLLPRLCNAIFTTLGTCNLEASYQRALCFELRSRGIRVTEELPLPILYGDCEIGSRRLDLLLTLPDGSQAIIELKAVLSLDSKHLKQLEYYLAHWSLDLGFLVNFPHEQGFPADHDGVFTSQILQGSVNISDRVLKPRVRDAVAQVVKVARAQQQWWQQWRRQQRAAAAAAAALQKPFSQLIGADAVHWPPAAFDRSV